MARYDLTHYHTSHENIFCIENKISSCHMQPLFFGLAYTIYPAQFNIISVVSVIGMVLCCNCCFIPPAELSGVCLSSLTVNEYACTAFSNTENIHLQMQLFNAR